MSSSKTVRVYRDWHDAVPVYCKVYTVHLDSDLEIPEELYQEYLQATDKLIELEARINSYSKFYEAASPEEVERVKNLLTPIEEAGENPFDLVEWQAYEGGYRNA